MAKKHFNIRLDGELTQAFKEKAKAHGTTPTALITQWIEQ
jgi:predicted DNA binding CopG/RHH family protein